MCSNRFPTAQILIFIKKAGMNQHTRPAARRSLTLLAAAYAQFTCVIELTRSGYGCLQDRSRLECPAMNHEKFHRPQSEASWAMCCCKEIRRPRRW